MILRNVVTLNNKFDKLKRRHLVQNVNAKIDSLLICDFERKAIYFLS
jgi:hypothetical protein